MKNFTRKIAKHLFALVVLSLLINNAFSQTDPNEPVSKTPMPLHVVMPLTAPTEPYGVDVVIPVGAFDNYQVSSSGGFLETDICVNPFNPLNFVCTDNRIITGANYVYNTTNGGVNWASPTISTNQGDPAFTADSLGNFYLVTLNLAVNGFVVYKSTNLGVSWSPTPFLPGGGVTSIDKEWIAADQTNGPFKNNVYIAFVNFTSGATLAIMRSTNNGAAWTLISGNLGSGTPNPGPDIAVDANGKVYVAWYSGGGTSVRTSTDGGTTWTAAVTASNHSQPGALDSHGRYVLKNDIRVNGMPHIAIDMTTGAHSGYVYCLYDANPPGPDLANVYCTRSTDGGATWSAGSPVRVNNDPGIMDQWMADISVDNQGRVWAMWWDSRNDDPANILSEQWAGCSTDGGLTFSNFQVGSAFNPNAVFIPQGGSSNYIGDYQGMSGKSFTFPCYVGINNTRNDYVAYLPDYGMSFALASDNVPPGGTSINRVRIPLMGPYSGTVTLTASVSPSPSPGTITFNWSPGNVRTINGSPDSVVLNSVVSASVPYNAYTITVTGAESAGPRTHLRSWTLNVGNFVGISHNGSEVPQTYQLFQNYPNPFNPTTVIYYSVPKQTLVNLKVYDILGREVAALVNNQIRQAGEYQVTFDASNFPSGIYYYRINAGEYTDVRKMILIK
jgi:Secretion system C-terminal sorting domain